MLQGKNQVQVNIYKTKHTGDENLKNNHLTGTIVLMYKS